jgi:hypothetical protein
MKCVNKVLEELRGLLLLLLVRAILRDRSVCIMDLQLGVQGGDKERKRERGSATKCADRTVCFHLIYQET